MRYPALLYLSDPEPQVAEVVFPLIEEYIYRQKFGPATCGKEGGKNTRGSCIFMFPFSPFCFAVVDLWAPFNQNAELQ